MGKQWRVGAVMAALLFLLSSCRWEPSDTQKALERMEGVVSAIGSSQITSDRDLIGQRIRGEDEYTGSYTAAGYIAGGRDVIFGGASLRPRNVHLTGWVKMERGEARLRVREGSEARYIEPDAYGGYDVLLTLDSGGLYIMMDYQEFGGCVELTVVPAEK